MLHAVKGTNFLIGSFVDAGLPDRQRSANVRCVLKCTDQLINGRSEARYDFHHKDGYFNLPFADDGNCPTDPGQNAFHLARDWCKGAEGIVKDEGGGRILVHSWTGMGKAVRIVAAYLCGWQRSQFKESLKRVYEMADLPKAMRREMPDFERALMDAMDEDAKPVSAEAPKDGTAKPKRRRGRPRRPKLDA